MPVRCMGPKFFGSTLVIGRVSYEDLVLGADMLIWSFYWNRIERERVSFEDLYRTRTHRFGLRNRTGYNTNACRVKDES